MSINAEVLALAGTWIGTPYRHQGAMKGVGCDCLGLIRGIWRELYGVEPEAVPAYAPDWAERAGEERLLAAAGRHFLSVPSFAESRPGDLVLFRFRPHLAAKHAGILALLPAEHGETDKGCIAHCRRELGTNREGLAPGGGPVFSKPGCDSSSDVDSNLGLKAPGACPNNPDAVLIPDAFIHAYEQSAVTLSALVPGWRHKIAGIYRFPERT